MKPVIRIGVSGWRYPPWRGEFYPDGLRQDGELHAPKNARRLMQMLNVNWAPAQTVTPRR